MNRLLEAKQLIANVIVIDEDQPHISTHRYDAEKFGGLKAFQLFYWLVNRVEELEKNDERPKG